MPEDDLTTPGSAAGGGPSDGPPAASGSAEAQTPDGGGEPAAPQGPPADPTGTAQDTTDWKKRYGDMKSEFDTRSTDLKAAQEELERYQAAYGGLDEAEPEATQQPGADQQGYPGQPGYPGYQQQPGYGQQAAAYEDPRVTALRQHIQEIALTDPVQATSLAIQWGLIPIPNSGQAPAQPQTPGLTVEQATALFEKQYEQRSAREAAEAQAFDDSLNQIRADVGAEFVTSVEDKLFAYADEHNEPDAWKALHAVAGDAYRAAVRDQEVQKAWAEVEKTNPGVLPRRPATASQPDQQPAAPNELTQRAGSMGFPTKPPSEDDPPIGR